MIFSTARPVSKRLMVERFAAITVVHGGCKVVVSVCDAHRRDRTCRCKWQVLAKASHVKDKLDRDDAPERDVPALLRWPVFSRNGRLRAATTSLDLLLWQTSRALRNVTRFPYEIFARLA